MTDCAVSYTFKEINKFDNNISIGNPLCNCKLYILNKQMKLVPLEVEGETFIVGYNASKRYLIWKN